MVVSVDGLVARPWGAALAEQSYRHPREGHVSDHGRAGGWVRWHPRRMRSSDHLSLYVSWSAGMHKLYVRGPWQMSEAYC